MSGRDLLEAVVPTDLPLIDTRDVLVGAPAPTLWRALTERIVRTRMGVTDGFAWLIGARPRTLTGTLLEEGSTMPGFAVTQVVPGERLVLTGRHRFSRYELVFSLHDRQDGSSILRAASLGEFPGLTGRAYRLGVIGSGGHGIVVDRMLHAVARAAERDAG